MFELFPQLRSGHVNGQCKIVSQRSLRICQLMHQAGVPLRANKLQAMLLAVGEKWAKGRPGYMFIWGQLRHLKQTGMVIRVGAAGFQLADDQVLADIFADSLARIVEISVPAVGSLVELREAMLRVALHFAIRGTAQQRVE